YDYPRFVCYDCHAYAPYYTWNPYAHSCVRFRVVIYDDPYYYPYRYYGGRRVVVVRPRRAEPRYVFVDNNGSNDYVTRIPNRPRRDEQSGVSGGGTGGDQMRPRRGEDVGGRGTIPIPGDPRRRVITGQPDQRPGDAGQGQPERRRIDRQGDKTGTGDPGRRDRPEAQPNPPGLEPQPQMQPDRPRREEPSRQDPQSRPEPQRPPEGRREEPRRQEPESRPEPQRPPEPRAEPRNEPRQEPRAEPKHEEPRRQPPSGGGGRSSSPELRRRRG
ncbi:MAG: hypothetical protein JF590_02535, partial [Gemmatimonadetes bacterium]|nr:hypothetical protein [Gemmatimonadota bacterium]